MDTDPQERGTGGADACSFDLYRWLATAQGGEAPASSGLHVALVADEPAAILEAFAARPAPRATFLHAPPETRAAQRLADDLRKSGVTTATRAIAHADCDGILGAVGDVLLDASLLDRRVEVNVSTGTRAQQEALLTAARLHGAQPFRMERGAAVHLSTVPGGMARLLDESQLRVLGALGDAPSRGASPGWLARRIGATRAHVVDALRGGPERPGLAQLGFAREKAFLGHTFRLVLTPEGHAAVAARITPTV